MSDKVKFDIENIRKKYLKRRIKTSYNFTVQTLYKSIFLSLTTKGSQLHLILTEVDLLNNPQEFISRFIPLKENSKEFIRSFLLYPHYLSFIPNDIVCPLNLIILNAEKEKRKLENELFYDMYIIEGNEKKQTNNNDKDNEIGKSFHLWQEVSMINEDKKKEELKDEKEISDIPNKNSVDIQDTGRKRNSMKSIEDLTIKIAQMDEERKKNKYIEKGFDKKNGRKSEKKKRKSIKKEKKKDDENKKSDKNADEDSDSKEQYKDIKPMIMGNQGNQSISFREFILDGGSEKKFRPTKYFIINKKNKQKFMEETRKELYEEMFSLSRERLLNNEIEKSKVKTINLPFFRERQNIKLPFLKKRKIINLNKETLNEMKSNQIKDKGKSPRYKGKFKDDKSSKNIVVKNSYLQPLSVDNIKDKITKKTISEKIKLFYQNRKIKNNSALFQIRDFKFSS